MHSRSYWTSPGDWTVAQRHGSVFLGSWLRGVAGTPIALMQPATNTSSFSPVFPVSSADAELTTTMPSLSIPLPAPSTIMGAADLEHALGAAPWADADGYWHCCKCFSGPHLADINVGCATCHHTRCGECSTK
ncbi:uncharacterized protein IWZ02DRAFT_494129 [Phyllosticta citriasiana]|uniref:uncharacterized protein n=1 Tax=Phyllosticta citriasiana TaxID=595635 RepID=UPI0030FD6D7F